MLMFRRLLVKNEKHQKFWKMLPTGRLTEQMPQQR